VIVTDIDGGPLKALLAVDPDVSWAGYANERIHSSMEPLLQAAMRKHGLKPQKGI
jgi:hypothetical protein